MMNAKIQPLSNHLRQDWDLIDLHGLKWYSPLIHFPLPEIFNFNLISKEVSPVINLPSSMDDYLTIINQTHRRKLRRSLRMFNELGPVEFELASENNLPEFLDDFFNLHKKSWQMRGEGEGGVLSDEKIQNFHKDFSTTALKHNHVIIGRLSVNGTAAAVIYVLTKDNKAYSYLGGFDPELNKFSPGNIILYKMIEHLINKNYT